MTVTPPHDVKAAQLGAANRPGNPLDLIEAAHEFQASICDILETIADSLPDDVDCRLAMTAADSLCIDLPLHHRDEEEGLFPLLKGRVDDRHDAQVVVAQFIDEHRSDEAFAEELSECLRVLASGERLENPEMVGYMLRGFFQSYRRHLHWENTILLPLARSVLTKDDLAELQKIFAANRRRSPAVREAFI